MQNTAKEDMIGDRIGNFADTMETVVDRLDRLKDSQFQCRDDTAGGNIRKPVNPSPSKMILLSNSIHQLSMLVQHDAPQNTGTGIEMHPKYWVLGELMCQCNTYVEEYVNATLTCRRTYVRNDECILYLASLGQDSLSYFKHIMFILRHYCNFTVQA